MTLGRLTVQRVYLSDDKKQIQAWAECLCSCGEHTEVPLAGLKLGNVTSCGCARGEHTFSWGYKWYAWVSGSMVRCHSSYEVLLINHFILRDIQFVYHPGSFKLSNGKRYSPDFYLPEDNLYLEAKGWDTGRQVDNREVFMRDGHFLSVIHKNQLVDYIGLPIDVNNLHVRVRKMLVKETIPDYYARGYYMDTEDLLDFRRKSGIPELLGIYELEQNP